MKNRLEELRRARGIRQEELAEALEVSRQTIGSLENGRDNTDGDHGWCARGGQLTAGGPDS